jgi:hypothetical protein
VIRCAVPFARSSRRWLLRRLSRRPCAARDVLHEFERNGCAQGSEQ